MVTIKEATQKAMEFAVDALGEQRTADMRLEEVDSWTIEGTDFWVITLSMRNSATSMDTTDLASAIGSLTGKREYKVFNVLKSTGETTSMKIRELATA